MLLLQCLGLRPYESRAQALPVKTHIGKVRAFYDFDSSGAAVKIENPEPNVIYAERRHEGEEDKITVFRDSPLFKNDEISTLNYEAELEISRKLGQGFLLARLKPNSTVTLTSQSKLGLLVGNFWVAARRDFIISTPGGTAGVRGTVLQIDVAPDSATTVVVLEGTVVLSNDRGTQILRAGEAGLTKRGSPPMKLPAMAAHTQPSQNLAEWKSALQQDQEVQDAVEQQQRFERLLRGTQLLGRNTEANGPVVRKPASDLSVDPLGSRSRITISIEPPQ